MPLRGRAGPGTAWRPGFPELWLCSSSPRSSEACRCKHSHSRTLRVHRRRTNQFAAWLDTNPTPGIVSVLAGRALRGQRGRGWPSPSMWWPPQVTHLPIKSSSKMGNTKPFCTTINVLLDDGKEISAGPVGGPFPRARISTLSAVTRDQDESENPARNTNIDISFSNEDTHFLKLTPSLKGSL